MKKALVAVGLVATTLVISAPAFADNPLPGGQPPCSIIHKTPAESSIGQAACTHPTPG
jgi:hypothetical protein